MRVVSRAVDGLALMHLLRRNRLSGICEQPPAAFDARVQSLGQGEIASQPLPTLLRLLDANEPKGRAHWR